MATSNSIEHELVFCHECDNEFWKDEHGLHCPACHSDFTEVIDTTTDPRAPRSPPPPVPPHPLHRHNPWESAPDPDEGDVRQFSNEWRSPNGMSSFSFSSTIITNSNGGTTIRHSSNTDPMSAMHRLFDGSALGNFTRMPGFDERGGSAEGDHTSRAERGSGGAFRTGTFSMQTRPDGRMQFASTGAPGNMDDREASTGNAGMMPADLLVDLLTTIGAVRPDTAGTRAGLGFGGTSMADMMGRLFNPAEARLGDAVFSQEALDRVMSQLMEQHSSGNAPGPASEAAIEALPQRPASKKELGEEMKADCSICMDEVREREEITVLPCSHWFHPDCVKFWLKEHDTCPVCRSGITPKEGSRDEVRQPSQAPLHDEDPVHVARRQSGSQTNLIVVPESPSRERRQPTSSGPLGGSPLSTISDAEENGHGGRSGSSGGLVDRVRNLFSNSASGPSSQQGDSAPR